MRPVSWGKGVAPQLQGTQSHHLPILGLDLLLGLAAPPTSSPPAQCLALPWFHSSRLLHPNHNAIIIPMPVGKAGQPRQLQPTFVLRVSGYKAPFALASPVAFSALIHTANPSGSRMSEGRRHTVLPQPTSLKAQAPPSAQAACLPTSLFTIAPWGSILERAKLTQLSCAALWAVESVPRDTICTRFQRNPKQEEEEEGPGASRSPPPAFSTPLHYSCRRFLVLHL